MTYRTVVKRDKRTTFRMLLREQRAECLAGLNSHALDSLMMSWIFGSAGCLILSVGNALFNLTNPRRMKQIHSLVKSKSKVVPLRSIQAHLGDRRYSSYSLLTSALEGGEWSASRPGRALPPGKEPPVPTVQEVGWAPEPVWTQRLEEKCSSSVGDRTPAVQSVVRHCTDYATPGHI
jgi:hypothetical protein